MKRKYISEEMAKPRLSPEANKAFNGMHMALMWAGCDTHTKNLMMVVRVMRDENIGAVFAVRKLLDSGEMKRDGMSWNLRCALYDANKPQD